MEISAFAIWKFKNVEGKLKGVIGVDFDTTKFIPTNNLSTEYYQLKYDYKNDKATLESFNIILEDSKIIATVPFSEVKDLLKKYKLYNVASLNERHTSSYDSEEKSLFDTSNNINK